MLFYSQWVGLRGSRHRVGPTVAVDPCVDDANDVLGVWATPTTPPAPAGDAEPIRPHQGGSLGGLPAGVRSRLPIRGTFLSICA
jgi:hypothetical protein